MGWASAVLPRVVEQKRLDHQYLVVDGILGYAELSPLCRFESGAYRYDPLVGPRGRRVRDLC